MSWHGEAPFHRFGEATSNSVFGLCDYGMRLLVARERQTRFASWTFPSDDDNQMKMSLPELAHSVSSLGPGQGTCGSSTIYVDNQHRRLLLRSTKSVAARVER